MESEQRVLTVYVGCSGSSFGGSFSFSFFFFSGDICYTVAALEANSPLRKTDDQNGHWCTSKLEVSCVQIPARGECRYIRQRADLLLFLASRYNWKDDLTRIGMNKQRRCCRTKVMTYVTRSRMWNGPGIGGAQLRVSSRDLNKGSCGKA